MMILESDGASETQLVVAGISDYILELIRHRLGKEYLEYGWPLVNEINALALWLACLTLSPRK